MKDICESYVTLEERIEFLRETMHRNIEGRLDNYYYTQEIPKMFSLDGYSSLIVDDDWYLKILDLVKNEDHLRIIHVFSSWSKESFFEYKAALDTYSRITNYQVLSDRFNCFKDLYLKREDKDVFTMIDAGDNIYSLEIISSPAFGLSAFISSESSHLHFSMLIKYLVDWSCAFSLETQRKVYSWFSENRGYSFSVRLAYYLTMIFEESENVEESLLELEETPIEWLEALWS